ncbi:uncharacterized protein LOC101849878 [Aplysia californica]|uniref:Uncharacterized protein LOC101849878 n=1 Tax=Aplysia californica TaxID=6500 RepID=A0ABM0K326_APLCA|nr:uncharacterized protein LOC101849878 [Aplysia californica]
MHAWITLVAVILSVHSPTGAEDSQTAVCQRSWTERHQYDSSSSTSVPTDALRTNILQGKPVKVTITKRPSTESFMLDNLNMNGQVICGESMERMSSPIGSGAEFQPIIVCTNGYVSYLNVSASRWDGNTLATTWPVDLISFKIRDIHPSNQPLVSLYLDGSSTYENANMLFKTAFKAEMRGVMRDRGYSFTMDNTHYDFTTGHLNGQSLSHISQSYTPTGNITFRSKPYHWLSSWDTSGRRDSSRFTTGDLQGLKHTNDFVALQWYADLCWTIVYVHDENGNRLEGSLDMLKMYIRMGHRVRVHFDGYTLEANSVLISDDDVIVAQTSAEMARRGGTGNDRTFFNTKTRQVYRLVHTTGLIRSLLYFIQTGKLSAKETERWGVAWSVDTRPWNPLVSFNSSNDVTFGDRANLAYAMSSDNLRVKVEIKEKEQRLQGRNSELFLEINNVRSPDLTVAEPEVIGQSLRTVPYYRASSSDSYYMPLYRPLRQYLEVSSTHGVTMSHFDMATKEFVATKEMPAESVTWYKDGGIQIA